MDELFAINDRALKEELNLATRYGLR